MKIPQKKDLDTFDFYQHLKNQFSSNNKSPFVLVDQNNYKQGGILVPFRNFFYSIGILYGKGSSFQIGGNQYDVLPGSLITIGPGVISQWGNDFDVPSDTILFTEDHLKKFLKNSFLSSLSFFNAGGSHVLVLSEEHTEKVKLLFHLMKNFKTDYEIVAGLTYSLLHLLIKLHSDKSIKSKNDSSVPDETVRRFKSLVAKHFLKHRRVIFYARELNITPKYLSEILLSSTGSSAKAAIDNIVFLEAKTLLRQTTMSIQQLCHHLGYADASYFTKAFKKREGVTPREYRRA